MTGMLVFLALSSQDAEFIPVALAAPPFEYTVAEGVEVPETPVYPVLTLESSRRNDIVSYEGWFTTVGGWSAVTFHNGGTNDVIRGRFPPAGIDRVLPAPGREAFHLYQVIHGAEYRMAMYGEPPNSFRVVLDPRILVIPDFDEGHPLVLDFLAYALSPADSFVSPVVTFQKLRWAETMDGVLYVSTTHDTYSSSSGGFNAYITALDLETLEILWRSEPLVSNSQNFVLLEDAIVTGYGFTDEDDYLYVLDRHTGAVVDEIRLPSMAEYLKVVDDRLFVRCYNRDMVFGIDHVE